MNTATKTSTTTVCRNCGQPPKGKLVRGLCPACRIFEHRHGRPRTEADMIRPKDAPCPVCRNCRQTLVQGHRSLCSTCRQYVRRCRRNRPRHLWVDGCIVCGRPKGRGFARGRCRTCYSYWRKHGVDRTQALVRHHTPLGFCDCGRPATQVMTLRVKDAPVEFHLCDDCAALERA